MSCDKDKELSQLCPSRDVLLSNSTLHIKRKAEKEEAQFEMVTEQLLHTAETNILNTLPDG